MLVLAVLSGVAWADIPDGPPPTMPDASCVGQPEGAACGSGGRCVKARVRRPDFNQGSPPTWAWQEVLVCEGGAPSNAERWFSALLVMLLLGAAYVAAFGGSGMKPLVRRR